MKEQYLIEFKQFNKSKTRLNTLKANIRLTIMASVGVKTQP